MLTEKQKTVIEALKQPLNWFKIVNADEFKITKKGTDSYRSFIIIRNEAMQYPVCVYRFSNSEYSALWMRCTHQGTELQARRFTTAGHVSKSFSRSKNRLVLTALTVDHFSLARGPLPQARL